MSESSFIFIFKSRTAPGSLISQKLTNQQLFQFCILELVAVGPEFYGNNSLAAQRFLSLEIFKCSWMSAWEDWCSIRVEDEFIAFPRLQELYLDVLLKYQDQHRALLRLLNLSNFLKQSFMQFCRLLVLTKLRLLQHST